MKVEIFFKKWNSNIFKTETVPVGDTLKSFADEQKTTLFSQKIKKKNG